MTTQKTTFENKPYSALFINGPYESRNVGIKLYIRYQLFFFIYITWYHFGYFIFQFRGVMVRMMVFNATFNNISIISWR
jgi:hypothetical protein